MISFRRVLTIALTSTLAVPLLSHAAIPSQYRITDIGSIGGSTTYGAALNDASPIQVTGTSWLADDTAPRAFLYTVGGTMTAIDFGVDEFTWGRDINDEGYVSADGGLSGFVYHNGVTTALPTLSSIVDGANTVGEISNSGFVTGTTYSTTGEDAHAFRYSLVTHSLVDLGTGPGLGATSRGTAVNDSGEVAGSVRNASNFGHAMFFDGVTMHDIHVANNYYGDAWDVNDSGLVVGQASLVVGNQYIDRAILHDGSTGTTTLLAPLPGSDWDMASSINNQGQIVGLGVTSAGVRPVLWSDGQVIDLNTRLEPSALSPYVVLDQAVDINESGWILATGYDIRGGATRSYLLEPLWPRSAAAIAGATRTPRR